MVNFYYHWKVLHRVIPWGCQCIPSCYPATNGLGLTSLVHRWCCCWGSLLQLKDWWFVLLSFGRHFGLSHQYTAKTWLKKFWPQLSACLMVQGIQITSAGQPHLGAALGSTYSLKIIHRPGLHFSVGSRSVSSTVVTQPHAAYVILVHGFSSKWNY